MDARLHLSNFLNCHAHVQDVQSLPGVKSILLIGVGTGLEVAVLRWLGYEVSTFDNARGVMPDYRGDVRDMRRLSGRYFDCVIASHVLEHVPADNLNRILKDFARISKYALIYLPVNGKQLRMQFHCWSCILDLPGPKKDPDHYWELQSWRRAEWLRRFEQHFTVMRHYRNQDWPASYNFVLQSKGGALCGVSFGNT